MKSPRISNVPFIRGRLHVALALLASTSAPRPSRAQTPSTAAAPKLSGEWAVEQTGRERWLHERQQPRFTRFHSTHDWLVVDSIRDAGAGKRLWLTLGRNAYGRDSALIDIDRYGRVAHLEFGRAAPSRSTTLLPADSGRWLDMQRRPLEGDISLGEARLWDLVPTAPPRAPFVGLTWQDTIALDASEGPYRQVMHGNRISRIFGDSMIAGHKVWLVRDEARVLYEEQYPERERTFPGAWVSRAAMGTINGVYLWDPSLPIPRQSDDTTRLSGMAILHYPDGRNFPTPARFERTIHRDLLDSAAHAERMTARRSAASRGMGGMVMVPDNALERRLSNGDTGLRDSLVAAWQRTADPDVAAVIYQMLSMWGARSAAARAELDSIRVAAGDTTFLYQHLANRAYAAHPFHTRDVRAMLPFMKDPQLPWSFGLSRDVLYENLAQALTLWPPIAASGAGDSACTPAACRLLADQWPAAAEPRLRDVALVARFVSEPAHWTDTVLALDGPGHSLLHGAARLARGEAFTSDAWAHDPIPAAGSDWRAWLQWMGGKDPKWVASVRQSSLPARMKQDTLPRVVFERSHATAIRFTAARTGRDIVAELRRGYESAASDSARLVFGRMLQGLGALQLSESQVADAFRSGDSLDVALARPALEVGLARSGGPADSSVTIPLLERLLAAIVDSTPLWPWLGVKSGTIPSDPAILHRPRGHFLVDSVGLPPRLRAEWGSRVELSSRAAWDARDVRQQAVFYTIKPVTTWGHFARVDVTTEEHFPRKPDERPVAYASGVTYVLMSVNGEWVIVDVSGWVT